MGVWIRAMSVAHAGVRQTRPSTRPKRGGRVDLPPPDPEESAASAGLRYVSDAMPGIRRVRRGRGFQYIGPDGATVESPRTRDRIARIVIPPAWTDVWISPSPWGHIQATGRDAKGRKQYRYHPEWNAVRRATKFEQLVAFGSALPRMRRRLRADLSRRGLPKRRVLATVVTLLHETLIRVGNAEYARDNDAYGLTTLLARHVEVAGSRIRFCFRGKSGKEHTVDVRDRRIARIVARCLELPGEELFQAVGEAGDRTPITSTDVNAYLKSIGGEAFTSKDFRTWGGTLAAARALVAWGEPEGDDDARSAIRACFEAVSSALGNTVAVCREYYVHPRVLAAFEAGRLTPLFEAYRTGTRKAKAGLQADEAALLDLLRSRGEGDRR